MPRIILLYLFMLVGAISLGFLIYGILKKKHRIKVLCSFITGASILIVGLLIQNPIVAWIMAIIALVFIIAPNNMKEIDFTKIG